MIRYLLNLLRRPHTRRAWAVALAEERQKALTRYRRNTGRLY